MTVSDQLRFAVLGPVRAWRGDHELRLGAPQQQAVLAAMLLRAGTSVSSAELIDTLWGDDVPASADQVLRTYVYRLRKILGAGPDGERAIISARHGYVIRTGPDNLDLAAFREDVRTAQQASRAGDRATALTQYDEALARWHGTPLAGLPGESMGAQRQHLELQRLAALEAKVVEQIELGDHADAEAVLTGLIRDFPLNERFRELQMLSLYRYGRQSDALTMYRRTQELLNEELGVDPGHGLRTLHEQILRGDPALLPAGGSSAPVPTDARPAPVEADRSDAEPAQPSARESDPVPAQLPADLRGFTGRTEELAAADALVPSEDGEDGEDGGAGAGSVVITGMAGVGKTAFALHWAHRMADRYPDGQLYLNFRGFDATRSPLTAAEALGAVFDSLGVRPEQLPADPDRQGAYLRSLVARRRLLFVLDNVRDIEQIRPLLPGGDCFVIVTSRHQLRALAVIDGAALIELDVLPADEAIGLLTRRIGGRPDDQDTDAMAAIVEWCGRLPLAIAVVAARVAVTPHSGLDEILTQLREERSPFDALAEADAVVDVRSVFSWSLKALTPRAVDLFRLLALTRSLTWDEQAAASLSALPVADVRRLLAELLSAHLVSAYGPGTYMFHDLIRLYAAELAAELPAEDRRDAILRLLDHYVASGQNAEAQLNPTRRAVEPLTPRPGVVVREFHQHDDGWAWFVGHREALQTAQRLAIEVGADEHAWRVSWLLQTYLSRVGHWQLALTMETAALAALERLDEPQLQARTYNSLGRLHGHLQQNEAALEQLNRAIDMFLHEAKDPDGAASALVNLAGTLTDLGQTDDAVRANERVLELTGNETLRSKALNGLAIVHNEVGDPERALSFGTSALQLAVATGDRYSEGNASAVIGMAHHGLGQYADAVRSFRQSMGCFAAIADEVNRADSIWRMGDSLLATGDLDGALAAWSTGLEILTQVDPPAAEKVRDRIRSLRPVDADDNVSIKRPLFL
jgi:DNA-binding SARP family transcriptional activator/predicted negative regulator of RcsB-dependent stress response